MEWLEAAVIPTVALVARELMHARDRRRQTAAVEAMLAETKSNNELNLRLAAIAIAMSEGVTLSPTARAELDNLLHPKPEGIEWQNPTKN